jgi:hypothetical protein
VKPNRKFVMAAVTALCLTTVVPRAQTPAAPQAPTLEGYPAVGSPSVIKMIDAGAQPRKALRYAVPAGFKGRMDMTMSLGINVNIPGVGAMPMNLPSVKMSADLAVTGVAANGDTSYTLAFSGVTVDAAGGEANPMMVGALQGMQSAITGIKGTSTMSTRGLVKSAKIDAGSAPEAQQMLGELTSQIENLATPFPEEAVGVGAKWETRQALKTAGQYMFQKVTTEVVSIDGSTVKLKFTTEQTVPQQAFTNPMLPAGTDVSLDGGKGTGSGTMAVRLDSLIPTGDSSIVSTMSMTINMGGQSQPMSMENTVKMTIAPGPVK